MSLHSLTSAQPGLPGLPCSARAIHGRARIGLVYLGLLTLALPANAQNKPAAPTPAQAKPAPTKSTPPAKSGTPAPSGKPTDKGATGTKPGDKSTAAAKPGDKNALPANATANAKPAAPVAPAAPTTPTFVKPKYPLGAVTALAFSPDGKTLAVGTFGQVVCYDTTTWKPMTTFRQVTDSARALAFASDGKMLAVGSGLPGRSGFLTLWDTSGASKPQSYPQQGDSIEAVAFRRDGKEMLLGADDNQVSYYPETTPAKRIPIDAHNGRVQAVACSPKQHWVFVTGALDKIVKVWDEKTHTNIVNFDQSEGGITGLAFLNNGDQFVGSSLDGRLYWWGVYHDDKHNSYGGYHFRTIGAHDGGVFALGQAKSGDRIITGGADNRVCIWNINDGGRFREFKDSAAPIYAVALNADGKMAAGGGREGCVYIWDVEASKVVAVLVPPALNDSTAKLAASRK